MYSIFVMMLTFMDSKTSIVDKSKTAGASESKQYWASPVFCYAYLYMYASILNKVMLLVMLSTIFLFSYFHNLTQIWQLFVCVHIAGRSLIIIEE